MGSLSLKRAVANAIIRLDSGEKFGLGHIMRSKALADALKEINIECTFAVAKIHSDEAVKPHQLIFINNEEEFISLAESYDIIIIDHYDYTTDLFFQLSKHQHSILVVLDDECNRGHLYADVIINPLQQALSLPYKEVSPKAKLLVGPDYLLLRKSFQKILLPAFEQRNLIVFIFGGSDVTGLTLPVLKTLENTSLRDFNIIVVTGAGCNNSDEIADYCHQNGFNHQHNVENMANIFANARLAISAAGSTAFELACCGVPTVFAVVADNQLLSITEQSRHGWCRMIDCREQNKPDELVHQAEKMLKTMPLESMSQIAQSMVDGKGAERVAYAIKESLTLLNR